MTAPASRPCDIDVHPRGLGAPGVGELKVVISPDRDLLCHGLTLHLPGSGDDPSLFSDGVAASGWTIERSGPATLRLTPAAGRVRLTPGTRQEIIVIGLTPSATPRQQPLVTTAELSTPAPTTDESAELEVVTVTHQLFSGGADLIGNFQPSCGNVHRCEKVTLRWGGPDDAAYTLESGTATSDTPAAQNITPDFDGHGNCSWTTQPLTATTAFRLTARKGGDFRAALTVVVVVDGDITAGNLSANGTVKLLQPPIECLNKSVEAGKCHVSYQKAPTDGILTFTINAEAQTAEMRIKTTPAKGDANPTVILKAAPGTRTSTVLPISKDAVVAVTLSGARATGYATWFAFGNGRLVLQQD